MRRRQVQRIVPTSPWNRLVDYYFRNRIEQVIFPDVDPWRHPWYTRAIWDPFEEHWIARVKPSCCVSETSAGDPTVAVPARLAPDEAKDRLGLGMNPGDDPVDAYLSESPEIVLPADLFRSIGTDAVVFGQSESVPAYFTERGVFGPSVVVEDGGTLVVRTSGSIADRSRARLLRACDLVLTHERPRTSVITQVASLDLDEVDVDLFRDAAGVTPDPYLYPVREYRETVTPSSLELLLGSAVDDGRDSIHLATVYLLSPAGAAPGSDPDGTWSAHVDHRVYWPLQYVTRFSAQVVEPTRVTVPAPQLGLGELGRIGERFAAAITENLQELDDALVTVRNEGRFGML